MPENSPWKAGYSMPKPPTTVAGKGVRVTQGQGGTTVVEQRRRNEFKSGERASRPASLPPPGGTGTALWTAWLEDNGVPVNPPVPPW